MGDSRSGAAAAPYRDLPVTPPSTDRRIQDASDLDALAFDARGLLPVVVQNAGTGHVLMLAWATRAALETTLATGTMHYWSRSRNALWKKGETSGNTQAVVSIHADCDGDTVLALVTPAGPACHTGEPACFGLGAVPGAPRTGPGPDEGGGKGRAGTAAPVLVDLWRVIEERAVQRPEGSYTTRLLDDENLRLKKLGEEVAELVSELARGGSSAHREAADLIYHLLVALKGAGASWEDVERELLQRML